MRLSNETKIGILTVLAIAVSLWGYKFIIGQNILKRSNLFYVEYQNVDRLKLSSPVLVNGYQVGVVSSIELKPDDYHTIQVILDVRRDIKIPKNTTATIISTGMMGGKGVVLNFERPCEGANCAESGDFLQGQLLGMIPSMIGTEDEVKGYVDVFRDGVTGVIDTLKNQNDDPSSPINRNLREVEAIIQNLKNTSVNLNKIVAASSSKMDGVLTNLESISSNIEASNASVKDIIDNAAAFSGQLKETDIKAPIDDATKAIQELKATLATAEQAIGELSGLITKVKNGEGSLGRLIEDESLYNQITQVTERADSLVADFQARPYRYMPLKSKRKVEKYDRN